MAAAHRYVGGPKPVWGTFVNFSAQLFARGWAARALSMSPQSQKIIELRSVKTRAEIFIFLAILALMSGLLGSCATRPAPGIKGSWKAVNHYAEMTEAIPLYRSYMFYPSPMDRTLKTMLTRWARDSKMTLSYLHPSDFTLHAPVAKIKTSNLQDAASQLSAIYAEQLVSITAIGGQIVVHASDSAQIKPAENATDITN